MKPVKMIQEQQVSGPPFRLRAVTAWGVGDIMGGRGRVVWDCTGLLIGEAGKGTDQGSLRRKKHGKIER